MTLYKTGIFSESPHGNVRKPGLKTIQNHSRIASKYVKSITFGNSLLYQNFRGFARTIPHHPEP